MICSALCAIITLYGSLLWALLCCVMLSAIVFLMNRYFRKPFNDMLYPLPFDRGWRSYAVF